MTNDKTVRLKLTIFSFARSITQILENFKPGKFNPHTLVAQKVADEVVFRRF